MGMVKIVASLLCVLLNQCNIIPLESSKVSENFVKGVPPTEYVVPRFYHPHTKVHIDSTANKNGGHINHLEIILPLKDTTITLDLRLNTNIMSKSFKQIYREKGIEKIELPKIEEIDYCHYSGKIKDDEDSWAALSTCDGLSGIIYNNNKFYLIEKSAMENSRVHHLHVAPDFLYEGNISKSRRKRNTAHNVLGGPYSENENSMFIELVMVIDNNAYKRLGSVTSVTSYATAMSNLVNAIYSRVNIFVVLVGVVIWTEKNEFTLETNTILDHFTNYVKTKLVKQFYFDNVQLISSINVIEDGIGVAGVGTICNRVSTGVIDDLEKVVGTAVTLAHELGHNLGLKHDTPDCTCPENQCIMVDVRHSDTISHFSSCSIHSLRISYESGKYFCLNNKPEVISSILPNCGNGILEPEEECDCGLLGYCNNSCCDALTCKYTNNSKCATGSCCNLETCTLKSAATLCRSTSNECDLPEYCTGDSDQCPKDTFKFDTEVCNDGESYCHQGICGTDKKCTIHKNNPNHKLLECYLLNSNFVKENNYCKTNIFSDITFKCNSWWTTFASCSQPKYETVKVDDSGAVTIYTSIYGTDGSLMVCTLAMVNQDLGGLQNVSLCNTKEVQCMTMSDLRKQIAKCPVDCNNNGWCNNKGHCHCKDGYAPPDCYEPGFGGSLESGPSLNPSGFILARNIMFIIFLAIVPLIAGIAIATYVILNEYSSCGTFFKTICSKKRAVPTVSFRMSQQEKIFFKNYDSNVNNTSSFPPKTSIENMQIDGIEVNVLRTNLTKTRPLSFSTFIRKMSGSVPQSSDIQNTQGPREDVQVNDVIYENVQEMENGRNPAPMFTVVNKNRLKSKQDNKIPDNQAIRDNRNSEHYKVPKTTKKPRTSYYEEFVKRKKKIRMSSSNPNSVGQSHNSSESDNSNSIPRPDNQSVKDLIKKFSTPNNS